MALRARRVVQVGRQRELRRRGGRVCCSAVTWWGMCRAGPQPYGRKALTAGPCWGTLTGGYWWF